MKMLHRLYCILPRRGSYCYHISIIGKADRFCVRDGTGLGFRVDATTKSRIILVAA